MPRRKRPPFTHEDVKAPEDLDGLDKQQRIRFLLSHREDKIELWNKWRMDNSSEIDLTEAQMDHANIEGADLCGASLKGAFFHFANLKGAFLQMADLEQTFMDQADLTEANLSGASLQNANLRLARLQNANLQGAHLNEANLQGAHLEEAHLPTAHLKRAVLHKANLTKANLSAARLQGAHLVGAQLEGANLSNAMLQGAYLNEAQAAKAILMGAFFKWSVLSATNFRGANLRSAQLEGAAVDNASFEQADLRLAHLRETALSSLAPGGLRGVRLYQTYFWGVLSLRYEQFLEDENPNGKSTIWEHTEGRFTEAKDVYKTLKGYFEDAGDYEGANWAYVCEQQMEKLMYAPRWIGWIVYPDWRSKFADKAHYEKYCRSHIGKWAWQVFAEGTSNYGTNWLLPPVWLVVVILSFAFIYCLFGMITDIPGCEYPNPRTPNCRPGDFIDALVFSVSAMTTVDSGTVQPYLSNVSLTASVEALLGIALTGLFGFVLGNKLRNS